MNKSIFTLIKSNWSALSTKHLMMKNKKIQQLKHCFVTTYQPEVGEKIT